MPPQHVFKTRPTSLYRKNVGSLLATLVVFSHLAIGQLHWPEVTREAKPWTRWWWEGSAVNEKDLTAVMQLYKQAGLGGLEITPIYGVQGEEKHNISFLSKKWMEMLEYTLQEGKKLDLGIDLANATGWPFGGPWVTDADASKSMEIRQYALQKGERLKVPVEFIQKALVRAEHRPAVDISQIKSPIKLNGSENLQKWALDQVRFSEPLPLVCLMAYDAKGGYKDLTSLVDAKGYLNWTAPSDGYQLYALFEGQHGKMVERAAPGGEGFVIDHFSATAVDHYLRHFDTAFNGYSLKGLRGFFNDSYEVDDAYGQADFTPALFAEFKKAHGYDLRQYLPELLNKDNNSEKASRVLSDYRQTIGELLLTHFTEKWQRWGKAKGKLIRNQSHGSPANILDLYAAVDIPETEGTDPLRFKFASSAANVTGKPLISSESATWLKDHFLSSLADVKKAIDLYFLGGINHVFYHGVAYSPINAPWPGWLFYAAVHFQPANPQWHNFAKLNDYISVCQSFLQNSRPDNDVLQYFPIYDSYHSRGKTLLKHYDGMNGFEGTAFNNNARWMMDNGYCFDFISDRQIGQLAFAGNKIKSAAGQYQTILLSAVNNMPEKTFNKILSLVSQGATVLVFDHLPGSVDGFSDLAKRQKAFSALKRSLQFHESKDGVQKATLGKGTVFMSDDLGKLLISGKVRRESITEHRGLQFIRRKSDKGAFYFIDNRSDKVFDGWIKLADKDKISYAIFNPMKHQDGIARIRNKMGEKEIFIQLQPWESVIVQAGADKLSGHPYPYTEIAGDPFRITGDWTLDFIDGGPVLPKSTVMHSLNFWTTLPDTNALNFSGTVDYTVEFKKPPLNKNVDLFRLDLGTVKENGEVILNGKKIATLLGPKFTVDIAADLLKDDNQIRIRVSSLMANRIRYMDRNDLHYKRFYNINFPAHDAENRGKDGLFTTAGWDVKPSGVKGPVTITPLKFMD